MKKIFRHLTTTVKALGYYLYTSLHKKDPALWLFGAWKGTLYSDNAKYLYEYVLSAQPDIRAMWITKNPAVYEKLTSEGKSVALYPSKEAKDLIKRAKYHFQTEGSRDIGYFPVGGATVIQLGHGIPVKSNKWWENTPKWKQVIINIENDNHSRSKWISTSGFFSENVGRFYNIPDSNFIRAGFPRCDVAFHREKTSVIVRQLKEVYQHVVIYLPTHRNWGKDFDEQFLIEGLAKLDRAFASKNICCLYKPHPNEAKLIRGWNLSLENIIVVDGTQPEYQDLYEYLYDCDLLISDYSSVIYDYVCTNRPMVLFNYDEENYKENDGGILPDYYLHPVGPNVRTWTDLATAVFALLENDTWKEQRTQAYHYFNGDSDGNSCRKITEYILKM